MNTTAAGQARFASLLKTLRSLSCVLRHLWAGPNTLLGLILAAVGVAVGGGSMSVRRGVIEAEGRGLAWALRHLTTLGGGATAITFGHVVLARDADSLATSRTHERVHVRQYERWGPLFIPLYLLASLWASLRGRHPYFDNFLEREAELHAVQTRTPLQHPSSCSEDRATTKTASSRGSTSC